MILESKFEFEEVIGLRFPTSLLGQSRAYSHVYFVDGLLIDTGHPRKRKQVLKATKDLPVKQIFVTHHHEDHTGNAKQLQKQFNCDVLSSELCATMMKSPPKQSFAQKVYWGVRGPQHNLIPVSDVLRTESHEFQIISVPGHSDDMAVLYEPNKKWLFSADLYINSRIGYFIKKESIRQEIESINSVLELDFDVLFCGHNPQLKNGKKKLQEKLEYLEKFRSNVSELYEKGMSESEIFKSMNLKELNVIKLLSAGELCKMNMVRSVIRDYCS